MKHTRGVTEKGEGVCGTERRRYPVLGARPIDAHGALTTGLFPW